MKRYLAILTLGLLAASCKGDPYPGPGPNTGGGGENTLIGVNEWIYDELSRWYYWRDAVENATPPSNSLAYNDFLETLVLDLRGAQDNTENPATTDGGNKASRGGRYVYSYILQFDAASTRAEKGDEGIETTFGFDIEPFIIGGTQANPKIGFLVLWVREGSPAYKAGLARGTWLMKYNGTEINEQRYENFFYQLHELRGGLSMTLTEGDPDTGELGEEYSLTAETMKVSPILEAGIITTDKGKQVAYLLYNQFLAGAAVEGEGTRSTTGGEFDYELRDVFSQFKDAGATELVLDLRYNGGGDLMSCSILTALIGNVDPTDIFAKLLYNEDLAAENRWKNPETVMFPDEPNSLKLNKVYVLTTESSASASEMVISSLRGVLGDEAVVTIGTRTEGKNVGMNLLETTIDGYYYEMWPITFKIMNAVDFCDYAGGFAPDYLKDDLYDVTTNGRGKILPLGDPQEWLLGTALTLIDGGTVTPDAATRAPGSLATVPKPHNPRRGGARMYEFPESESESEFKSATCPELQSQSVPQQ